MNYLYNGKELPALPEWDKETCPYAIIITGIIVGATDLYCSSEPYIAEVVDGYNQITTERVNLLHYRYRTEEYVSGASDGWEQVATSITIHPAPLWTNTDIFYEDGTLYLAASDPVPVTTAAPIDPTSFMQGWLVVRRIAAMRGKKT